MNSFYMILQTVLPAEGGILLVFFIAVFITSMFEKEERAAYLSLLFGILLSLPFLLPFLFNFFYPVYISVFLVVLPPAALLVFFSPFRGRINYTMQHPAERYDERDTMFSRRTLVPGTGEFDEYYGRQPGNKPLDNKFRKLPGLLKAGTKYHDPILFAAANSIFERVVEKLHPKVEGEVAEKKVPVEKPGELSQTLIRMALDWGAVSAGITELRDYHVYSHGGREERYGKEFQVEHKYALALTVEMDYDMMRAAPAAPTVLESANQYLQSGMIAVQLAKFIRSMGYPARAHIDGNYKVICPLVARDAGLGEIGRMGLLMTPRLGPRCRIAVVTTDLPLINGRRDSVASGSDQSERSSADRTDSSGPDQWLGVPETARPDPTVIDFCRRCEKCAVVCPTQSIEYGPEKETNGVKRWKIDDAGCFTYWCQAGTDCGRCMIVCPYAHPDNWFHRLIRFGIKNNALFRRLAVPMDDLFYGKKPGPRPIK